MGSHPRYAGTYKRRFSLKFDCISNTLMREFNAPDWDTSHAAHRPHDWYFMVSR